VGVALEDAMKGASLFTFEPRSKKPTEEPAPVGPKEESKDEPKEPIDPKSKVTKWLEQQ
jgi:hypothetical protein